MEDTVVLDQDSMRRTLVRLAHEIVEKNPDTDTLAVVGIHRRGAVLGSRIHEQLVKILGHEVPIGELDISFYRDDLNRREDHPVVHSSNVPFDVNAMNVIVVDDVLHTGRTVRAAIEALFDYGRPATVQLAVLADRGHRELPMRPDYVGKNLPTQITERVNVHVVEIDDVDEVRISGTGQVAA